MIFIVSAVLAASFPAVPSPTSYGRDLEKWTWRALIAVWEIHLSRKHETLRSAVRSLTARIVEETRKISELLLVMSYIHTSYFHRLPVYHRRPAVFLPLFPVYAVIISAETQNFGSNNRRSRELLIVEEEEEKDLCTPMSAHD